MTTLMVATIVGMAYIIFADNFAHEHARGVEYGYEWGYEVGEEAGLAKCPLPRI